MSQDPRVLDAVCVCALSARRSASEGASELRRWRKRRPKRKMAVRLPWRSRLPSLPRLALLPPMMVIQRFLFRPLSSPNQPPTILRTSFSEDFLSSLSLSLSQNPSLAFFLLFHEFIPHVVLQTSCAEPLSARICLVACL